MSPEWSLVLQVAVPLLLIIIGYTIGRGRERRHYRRLKACERNLAEKLAVTNFNPSTPVTIRTMHRSLRTSRDSPSQIIPMIATPTAPIPVQTA